MTPLNMKMRAILVAGGLLAGLAGIGALTWGAIAALIPHLGTAGAAASVGAVVALGAAIALSVALRPNVPVEEELSGLTTLATDTIVRVKTETIESIAERSVGTINKMVDAQPLPTLLGVAVAAFAVARTPDATAGVFDRVLGRLL